ncbi:MAG: hypothetical protein IPN67_04225 [Bacteroidales bacterium]|nr:hypothetical protein [Bacteroidales bacterium]MBK8881601.1 hypothetical protein [Bacteroidales bacterium]
MAYLTSGLVKIQIASPFYEQNVRIIKAHSNLELPMTFGDKIYQYSGMFINSAEAGFIDINAFRYLIKRVSLISLMKSGRTCAEMDWN